MEPVRQRVSDQSWHSLHEKKKTNDIHKQKETMSTFRKRCQKSSSTCRYLSHGVQSLSTYATATTFIRSSTEHHHHLKAIPSILLHTTRTAHPQGPQYEADPQHFHVQLLCHSANTWPVINSLCSFPQISSEGVPGNAVVLLRPSWYRTSWVFLPNTCSDDLAVCFVSKTARPACHTFEVLRILE